MTCIVEFPVETLEFFFCFLVFLPTSYLNPTFLSWRILCITRNDVRNSFVLHSELADLPPEEAGKVVARNGQRWWLNVIPSAAYLVDEARCGPASGARVHYQSHPESKDWRCGYLNALTFFQLSCPKIFVNIQNTHQTKT